MANELLDRALALFDGNQTALAKALGVPQQSVCYWARKGVPRWREAEIRDFLESAAHLEDLTPPWPKKRATA